MIISSTSLALPISCTYFVNVETKSVFTSSRPLKSCFVYSVHTCLIKHEMSMLSFASQFSFGTSHRKQCLSYNDHLYECSKVCTQRFCYLSDFNKSHNVVTNFSKNPKPENSQISVWSNWHYSMRTDGQTYMSNLVVAVCNRFGNALKRILKKCGVDRWQWLKIFYTLMNILVPLK